MLTPEPQFSATALMSTFGESAPLLGVDTINEPPTRQVYAPTTAQRWSITFCFLFAFIRGVCVRAGGWAGGLCGLFRRPFLFGRVIWPWHGAARPCLLADFFFSFFFRGDLLRCMEFLRWFATFLRAHQTEPSAWEKIDRSFVCGVAFLRVDLMIRRRVRGGVDRRRDKEERGRGARSVSFSCHADFLWCALLPSFIRCVRWFKYLNI